MFKKVFGWLMGIAGFLMLVFVMMGRNHKEASAALENRKLRREKDLIEIDITEKNLKRGLVKEKEKKLAAVNDKILKQEQRVQELEDETDTILNSSRNKLRKLHTSQNMDTRIDWLKNSMYTPKRFSTKESQ